MAPTKTVKIAPIDNTLPPITIRAYRPEDHDVVVKLFEKGAAQSIDLAEGKDREEFLRFVANSLETDLADIEGYYFAKGGYYWVTMTLDAEGNEDIIGCVGLENKGNGQGELFHMMTRADYQRRGIGRLQVIELENWAREHGFHSIVLGTSTKQVWAMNFYTSLGYKLIDTNKFSSDLSFLRYEKSLV